MGNNSINSFSEVVNDLVKQSNIAFDSVNSLQESFIGNNETVSIKVEEKDIITGQDKESEYTIPSFTKVINDVNNLKQINSVFLSGEGELKLSDGTTIKVQAKGYPNTPDTIINVNTPKNFVVQHNWFFENLLFPKLNVKLDLNGVVDDEATSVLVKRVIVDNENQKNLLWFRDNIQASQLTYGETISILSENNIRFWEDEDEYEFPLVNVRYRGDFKILDKTIYENNIWYVIDNPYYSLNNEDEPVNNIMLKIGDLLSYNDKALYKILDISSNSENTKVRIEAVFGFYNPVAGKSFSIYDSQISNKSIYAGIGYDELNVLFIKGVNKHYNLLSPQWSYSIAFYSNDLVLENNSISLDEYYFNFVSDFGKQLEGQVKEKYIPAFYGEIPNAPVITANDFRVVQINTQLNSTLNTQEVTNTQRQIVESKSQIDSLKVTIAKEKQNLITDNDPGKRKTIQDNISAYTNKLSVLTAEYSSLVKSLVTLAFESDVVDASPKYRLRGFFNIPALKHNNNDITLPQQQIVQFEIAYRYLRLDSTGTALNTFKYIDSSTGEEMSGVYSDWVIVKGKNKEKIFDADANAFVWLNENITSGEEININQIDIPIQKGEKVEVKIRSISEAGWPMNPLKSKWSNPIISEFPANIEVSSQISYILNQAKEEDAQLQLNNTLGSVGVLSHLDDTIPNTDNTNNSIYYKHISDNIAYIKKENNKEFVVSVQSQLDFLSKQIELLMNK